MIKHFLLIAVLFLAGCSQDSLPAQEQSTAVERYVFEGSQYTSTNLKIEIVEHPSLEHLREAYTVETGEKATPGYVVMAYTHMRYDGEVSHCRINILDPHVQYMPDFIGHELMHCVHGQFHPTQP